MRRFQLAPSVFALMAAGALALPAQAANDEKDVLSAMDAWKEATMKKDKALFDKVYHPALSYGHSSGLIETKAQAVEHVVSSKGSYDAIELTDPKVTVLGKTALLTGKAEMRQRSADGKLTVNNLVYLTVWTKGPKGWQMLARQATRPPATNPTAAAPATPPAGSATPTAQTPPAKKP